MDFTNIAILGLTTLLVVLIAAIWIIGIRRGDIVIGRRRHSHEVIPADERIKIIPSSEATDPRTYAIMRAMETGRPVVVNVEQDGTWTDETGNVIER